MTKVEFGPTVQLGAFYHHPHGGRQPFLLCGQSTERDNKADRSGIGGSPSRNLFSIIDLLHALLLQTTRIRQDEKDDSLVSLKLNCILEC